MAAAGTSPAGTAGAGPVSASADARAPRGRIGRPGEVGERATRPPGPPVPSPRRRGRPPRCGGRSCAGGSRAGDGRRRSRPSPSRSSFLSWSAPSRRRFRISTRASSIRLWTTLTRSLRRSSVSGGMFSRTTVPSTLGISPMSLLGIAFSMAPRTLRSQGWMTIWCGSGTLIPASWLSGVWVP